MIRIRRLNLVFLNMKQALLGLATTMVAIAGIATAKAQVSLPLYEPFPLSYTNSPDETVAFPQGGQNNPAKRLNSGAPATLWSIGGSAGGGSAVVVGPAALSYPGLAVNPSPSGGLYIRTTATTANRSRGILFSTVSFGSVYFSFLLNVEQFPDGADFYSNRVFAVLSSATSGASPNAAATGAGIGIDSDGKLTVTKRSVTTPTVVSENTLSAGTHLIVGRYTFDPEGDDEVAVWIDPESLAVGEENVPAPLLSTTTGADQTSISSFYILHPQSGSIPAGLVVDEIRVGTTWAEVTPTGVVCIPASIVTSPTDQLISEGLKVTLSVVAAGTDPTFQWQRSLDFGANWEDISGATNQSYLTPILAEADSGTQYRAVVSVECDNSTATSDPATVYVMPATFTPNGVILTDTFADGNRSWGPVTEENSVWYASSADSLIDGTPMVGFPQTSSTVWLGFFTDDPFTPIHLDVGKELRVTLEFSAQDIVATAENGLRVGLFDYADGANRPGGDGNTVPNGASNVRGYMSVFNFGQTFNDNTPIDFYVRNNISAGDLMGTTANFQALGSGPSGEFIGAPALENGTTYTLILSVARTDAATVRFTTSISGGGSNWSHSVTDTTYVYPRFDALAIRTATQALTASQFDFSLFKVEVVDAVVPVEPFNITEVQHLPPASLKLTWESVNGKTYHVLSTTDLSSGSWTTNATVVATGASTSFTNTPNSDTQRFFRVLALP